MKITVLKSRGVRKAENHCWRDWGLHPSFTNTSFSDSISNHFHFCLFCLFRLWFFRPVSLYFPGWRRSKQTITLASESPAFVSQVLRLQPQSTTPRFPTNLRMAWGCMLRTQHWGGWGKKDHVFKACLDRAKYAQGSPGKNVKTLSPKKKYKAGWLVKWLHG